MFSTSSGGYARLTKRVNHTSDQRKVTVSMNSKSCPDVSIAIAGKKYRLVLSTKLYKDRKQRYIPLNLRANEDLLEAQQKQIEVQRELNTGIFDPTLDRYRPWKQGARYTYQKPLSLLEVWDTWCEHRKQFLEESTYLSKHRKTLRNCLIKFCDTSKAREITIDRDTVTKLLKFVPATINRKDAVSLLRELEDAINYLISQSKYIGVNYFAGISKQVPRRKSKINTKAISSNDLRKAYTEIERDAILRAFQFCKPHYYLFVHFLFYTGCRFGEGIEVRWSDIDPEITYIAIRRSYSSVSRSVKSTKTDNERIFYLGKELKDKLELLYKCTDNKDGLIFKNSRGSRVNGNTFERQWNSIIDNLYDQGLISVKLSVGHTRHTFNTIARQKNSAEDIAVQLGHSKAIADKHYTDSSNSKALRI